MTLKRVLMKRWYQFIIQTNVVTQPNSFNLFASSSAFSFGTLFCIITGAFSTKSLALFTLKLLLSILN